jgi:hypothetical protein
VVADGLYGSFAAGDQPHKERFSQQSAPGIARKSLLASLGAGSHSRLSGAGFSRQFTIAANVIAAAAPAEVSGADDVVAKVLSCAATNDTETGVLSQVRSGLQ